MKKTKRKLDLSTATIRNLGTDDLGRANGGQTAASMCNTCMEACVPSIPGSLCFSCMMGPCLR